MSTEFYKCIEEWADRCRFLQEANAKLESQLTQRTAELEAVQADKAKWEDIAGLRFAGDHKFVKEMELLKVENANLQAELERVRALVKALPKVEGEIELEADIYNYVWANRGELMAQFEHPDSAKAYIALLNYRRTMEPSGGVSPAEEQV